MIKTLNETTRILRLQLYLNFHDHIILVSSNEEELLKKLEAEFNFFVVNSSDSVDTTLDLFREIPPELPAMVASEVQDTYTIYRLSSRKYIDYHSKALEIWDEQEEAVRIYTLDNERLFEMSFQIIENLLTKVIDKKGYAPLFGTGVSLRHTNLILLSPSKVDSLLPNFLKNQELKILSDHLVLVDLTGRIHGFPLSVNLEHRPEDGPLASLHWKEFSRTMKPPRWVSGLGPLSSRIETENLHNRTMLVAGLKLSQGKSLLTLVPKWKMILPLFKHMIIPFKFSQLSWTELLKTPYHVILRIICAFNLIRRSRCYHFYMGADKETNAQILIDEIYAP